MAPSSTPTFLCVMSSGHTVNNLAVYLNGATNALPYTTDGTGCAHVSDVGSFIGQYYGQTVSLTFTYGGTGYVFTIPVARTTTVNVP
jgi:hypothetical protein